MAMRARAADFEPTYTAEEFLALPDDGNHYELIEGKLIMAPATGDEHGTIAGDLYLAMRDYLRAFQVGKVWFTTGFYIGKKPNGKDNVPEPDLGFIIASRVPTTQDKFLPVPDLIVEVWSRKSDLSSAGPKLAAQEKIRMFLRSGTQVGWGINPVDKEIEIYERGSDEAVQILKVGQFLEAPTLLPHFRLPVADLFK